MPKTKVIVQILFAFAAGLVIAIAWHSWSDSRRVFFAETFLDGTMPLIIEMVDSQSCKQLQGTATHSGSTSHCVPRSLEVRADLVLSEQRGRALGKK